MQIPLEGVLGLGELISCTAQASEVMRQAGAQDRVALLIDDRLDAVMLLVSRE